MTEVDTLIEKMKGKMTIYEDDLDEWMAQARFQAELVITESIICLLPYKKGSLVFYTEGPPIYVPYTTRKLMERYDRAYLFDYSTQRGLYRILSGKRMSMQPIFHQSSIWLPLTGPSQYPCVWVNLVHVHYYTEVKEKHLPYRTCLCFIGDKNLYIDHTVKQIKQRLLKVEAVNDCFTLYFKERATMIGFTRSGWEDYFPAHLRCQLRQSQYNKLLTFLFDRMSCATIFLMKRTILYYYPQLTEEEVEETLVILELVSF